LTNDLLIATGHQDVRRVRDRYFLKDVLRFHNCNINDYRRRNVLRLQLPHLLGNTFVVKTHHIPTGSMLGLITRGAARATYIYRDPRDVVLSSMEMGEKLRQRGLTHTFGQHTTLAEHTQAALNWCRNWEQWMALDPLHTVRYEALKADPVGELRRLVAFLDIEADDAQLKQALGNYQDSADSTRLLRYSHKNKGVAGRYQQAFTADEIAFIESQLGDYITAMGYELVAA
jgi:hypothetical protein